MRQRYVMLSSAHALGPSVLWAALVICASSGCETAVDAPDSAMASAQDAGRRERTDGATDAGADAATDASVDASVDAGADTCGRGPVDRSAVVVYLDPGDDFQAANDSNPPGTIFGVNAGTHSGQRVVDPKQGNQWLGEPGAVLDGGGTLTDAFAGTAVDVVLRGFEIRDYADNGIFFDGGSGVVIDRMSIVDTGSGDGEGNGAVRFSYSSDITVTASSFERVSSGVLPTACTGPIVIERNTGLNIGRNFVQLADVSGGGIRVRYNSMERDGTYLRPGNADVEDWISVYNVTGLADDYVQISYNRARGHGPSGSGSFIMMGDGGGMYQEAVGNVGVTPGQVGIGLSGGDQIEVRDNVMYSETWDNSNIAFYSADYGRGVCANHRVIGNRANWTNATGIQNSFWSSGACLPLTEADNVFPDDTVGASIWDDWSWSC